MSALGRGSAASALLIALMAGLLAGNSRAADRSPEVDAAIKRGVASLNASSSAISADMAGLVAYTMISAGESPDSALPQKMVTAILGKFTPEGYKPTAHHIYEAGVDAMALVAADRVKYKDKIQILADFILADQRTHGGWDYHLQDYRGDTSISQYAMLGLWAAARAGVQIPAKVWDQSATWHIQTQLKEGCFGYHPLGGDAAPKHSMTVAGVGSLGIAKIFLGKLSQEPDAPMEDSEPKVKKSDKAFGVLERVTPKEQAPEQPPAVDPQAQDANYKPKNNKSTIDKAISGGMGWLSKQYTIEKPLGWHLYYLYGLERVASLQGVDRVGTHDWYREGCQILFKLQSQDGSWTDIGGPIASTCFAILFLCRATEKLVPNAPAPTPKPKAQTFAGGLQEGGRGLPTNLENVDTTGNKVKTKKLDTPLDKLLSELENPKSDKIESAQAALVEAVQVGQREQLIGKKEVLLKLATDKRVDVRRTAYWALARCNDLRVAPVLIQGLMDSDYDAAVEARNALCVLSRRPRGFGLPEDLIAKLPDDASQAQKDAAFEQWRDADIRRWRDWYQSVRPYSERDKLPD